MQEVLKWSWRKRRDKKWINLAQSHKGSEWLTYRAWRIVLKTICQALFMFSEEVRI